MFTTRKMRKSRTSLREFEGLETRELLAGDLFAANSTSPVEKLSPADAPCAYFADALNDNIKEHKELNRLARKVIMDSAELNTQAIRALG